MRKIVLLSVVLSIFACKNEPKTAQNKIKEDVAYLADDKLEGRQTGTNGEKLAEYELESPPVLDGMIAAGERLYLSTQDGRLLCFGGK